MTMRKNIVVWCKEQDHLQDDDDEVKKTNWIKPCVYNSYQQPPCGYKLCEPMINYLRDYERR